MSAVLVINGVILTVFFLPKSGAVYLKKTKAGKEIASYERYHALERWQSLGRRDEMLGCHVYWTHAALDQEEAWGGQIPHDSS